MATKKKTTGASQPEVKGLSDTKRWIYGFALLFFALFVGVAVVSYFIYWRDDQNVALWSRVLATGEQPVMNWGGKLGAVLANYIVGDWFGLFGFCVPVVLVILSLRIMRFRPAMLRKSVRLTLILMILGSLTLGYLFGDSWTVFGSGLGGQQGIEVSRWLVSVLGRVGVGLLLLLSIILYAIYVNRNTISLLNRVGKEIVDNGKKVGGAVTSTATEMIRHELRGGNKKVAAPAATEPAEGLAENAATEPAGSEDDDVFTVRDASERNDTPFYPGELIDDDGFVVVDRSGLSRPPIVPKEEGAPAGRTEIDDDGFVVTDLTVEEPPRTEVDEDGFTIQYASGDGEALREPAREAVDSVPVGWRDPAAGTGLVTGAALEAAGGAVGQEARAAETSAVAASPEGRIAVGMPQAGASVSEDDRFVASVPGDAAIEERDDMAVERLPQDETLSEDEIESTLYDPTLDLSSYQRPPVELLEDHSVEVSVTSEEIVENKNRIKETLENFGIRIEKIKATIGPTVTLYEIVPSPGVRISKIKNLEDDIALSLSALGIRIIAPIPGKGTIGIEVPNKDKKIVSMYSVIKSVKFQESKYDIPVVLGKTIQDETFVIDLAKMPHLLVAGATGQGKSVGLNAIITSLLYKKHPSELKLVLVDPKKVELTLYSKLERHFLAKMPGEDDAIITDTHKVIYTLNSLCIEMDARYNLLRAAEVRKITEYNDKFIHCRLNPQKGHRYLPYIVVIIDEFADLIMTAGREIETPIARIAQLARAVGIHLVIATQRPTTNIITGVIKANFPARIAFRVTSMVDSRTIIDQPGANQLIGRGDMLVSTGNDLIRVQCAFVDTPEIERITEFIASQRGYVGAYELPEYTPEGGGEGAAGNKTNDLSQLDSMFEEVARFVVQNQQGSTSSIQRRFSIGYNRAGRIMDQLEMAGVVGKAEGSKPREVLIADMMSLEKILSSLEDL